MVGQTPPPCKVRFRRVATRAPSARGGGVEPARLMPTPRLAGFVDGSRIRARAAVPGGARAIAGDEARRDVLEPLHVHVPTALDIAPGQAPRRQGHRLGEALVPVGTGV